MTPFAVAQRSDRPGESLILLRDYLARVPEQAHHTMLTIFAQHLDSHFGQHIRVPSSLFANDLHYFFCGNGQIHVSGPFNAFQPPEQIYCQDGSPRRNNRELVNAMSEDLKELAEQCISEMIDDDLHEQTRSFFKSCFAQFFREQASAIFREEFACELEKAIGAEFRQSVLANLQKDRECLRDRFVESIREELREELAPDVKEELRRDLLQRLLSNPDAMKLLLTDDNATTSNT